MSAPFLSQFNIGGTWTELHLNDQPPDSTIINIGCYVHDLDSDKVYYRTIDNNIIPIIFGSGSTVPPAQPTTRGIVYGLSESSSSNTAFGYNTLNTTTAATATTAIGSNALSSLSSGSNNVVIGNNFSSLSAATSTTTVGGANTTNQSSLSDNITIGSNNTINASNTFVIGNNITASAPNTLYLDSNIESINAPGLITNASTTLSSYGLLPVTTNGITTLQLGSLPSGVGAAMPHSQGSVFGLTPNDTSNNTSLGYGSLYGVTGTDNTIVGSNFLTTLTNATTTTTVGAANTTSQSSLSDNITIGSSNTINASNAIVLGNNITASTTDTLYLDPTITTIEVGSLVTATEGNYGLAVTTSTASNLSTISIGPLQSATPTLAGVVYGSTPATTNNLSLGYNTLAFNTGTFNLAIGTPCMTGSVTGTTNLGIGTYSLNNLTGGYNNVGVGVTTLNMISNSSSNTAMGVRALASNIDSTVLPSLGNNTAMGYQALDNLVTGNNNTAVGSLSLSTVTTGTNNVCMGDSLYPVNNIMEPKTATFTTTVGSNNQVNSTTTTLSNNITVGSNNTIDAINTFVIGNNITASTTDTLYLDPTITTIEVGNGLINSTGSAGYGLVVTSGTSSSALTLAPITGTTPSATPIKLGTVYGFVDNGTNFNTAIGYSSLGGTRPGTGNTIMGYSAFPSNNNSTNNTAMGDQALYNMNNGNDNVAIGYNSLYNNGYSGALVNYNTAVGSQTLYYSYGSSSNTALGYQALYNIKNNNNTAVGYQSLLIVSQSTTGTSSTNNVCMGDSFYIAPSKTVPTIVGNNTSTLGSNNQVSSAVTSLTDNITIGSNNTISASNAFVIGNGITASSANTLYLDHTITDINISPSLANVTSAVGTDTIVPLQFDATTGNVYRGNYVYVSYYGSIHSNISNSSTTTLVYPTSNQDINSVNSTATYLSGVFNPPVAGLYEYTFNFAIGVAQSNFINGSTVSVMINGRANTNTPINIATTTIGSTTYGSANYSLSGIVNLTTSDTLSLQYTPGSGLAMGGFDFYPNPGMTIKLIS